MGMDTMHEDIEPGRHLEQREVLPGRFAWVAWTDLEHPECETCSGPLLGGTVELVDPPISGVEVTDEGYDWGYGGIPCEDCEETGHDRVAIKDDREDAEDDLDFYMEEVSHVRQFMRFDFCPDMEKALAKFVAAAAERNLTPPVAGEALSDEAAWQELAVAVGERLATPDDPSGMAFIDGEWTIALKDPCKSAAFVRIAERHIADEYHGYPYDLIVPDEPQPPTENA